LQAHPPPPVDLAGADAAAVGPRIENDLYCTPPIVRPTLNIFGAGSGVFDTEAVVKFVFISSRFGTGFPRRLFVSECDW
jgi:hypothetical protein